MSRIKDALADAMTSELLEEAMEGLSLWSSINVVSEAVVTEVQATGASKTLDELFEKIKELYKE